MIGCSKEEAAKQILSQFSSDVKVDEIASYDDFVERQKILLKFSDCIRTYIQANLYDNKAFDRADKITFIFDELNNRNSISNEGLVSLIEKLEKKLNA